MSLTVSLVAPSLAATHAVAATVAACCRPGDIVVLAGEMGAGKTAFAQGFGKALGVAEPITSPTFTLVQSYATPAGQFHHADVYRLEQLHEVADLALGELAEFRGIVVVEWGDVVSAALGDHLEVRLGLVDDITGDLDSLADQPRRIALTPSGRSWAQRWPTLAGHLNALDLGAVLRVDPAMLILGIETATAQVSVAIGGHEGVIALFEVARGRRHAETLVPAIEFCCAQSAVAIDELGLVAVDVGPGLFTGMRVGLATAKALAQALRLPMIGISSLDLLAFPHRQSDRVVVPVVDARKGEVFYAMYRAVPGGVQQVVAPRAAPVDELVADLLARNQDTLCVGDGALRYRREIGDGFHCEFVDEAHPSAGPLVQLAHAKALREEWVQPAEIHALYLRPPDADINWTDAGRRRNCREAHVSILERVLDRAVSRPVVIEPMRVRHIGQIMAIERDAYPRPWSANVFHDELRESRHDRRYYIVARRGRTVLGYGGIMFVPAAGGGAGEAHITNIAVHRDERRAGLATRLLGALAGEAIGRGCSAWTLEVRATSRGAQQLYRRFGFVPAGVRKKYYENDIDAIVMWCHDIQSAEYARRLEELLT